MLERATESRMSQKERQRIANPNNRIVTGILFQNTQQKNLGSWHWYSGYYTLVKGVRMVRIHHADIQNNSGDSLMRTASNLDGDGSNPSSATRIDFIG